MTLSEQLAAELTREAPVTRRLIERIPEDKLDWKPHAKSMSVGQLAYHLAVLPMVIPELASELTREAPRPPQPQPATVAEILAKLDECVAAGAAKILTWSDADLFETWRLTNGGATILESPRVGVIRSVLLNHWYHHRGQLTVYLRLLDVALPSTYG